MSNRYGNRKVAQINSDNISMYDVEIFRDPSTYRNFIGKYEHITGTSYTKLLTLAYTNIGSVSNKDFYALKNKNLSNYSKDFVYPMAVRYISSKNTYVIERPPFKLNIDYRQGTAYSNAGKFPELSMWVPWTVMVFNGSEIASGEFNNVKLYFNDGPIQSLDDILINSFYPNSYSDARICYSGSLSDFNNVLSLREFENGNISYIYNYIFNNYMMGGWNSDLDSYLPTKFYRAIAANKGSQPPVPCKSFPMLELFVDPKQDEELYKKIANSVPKVFFNRLKKLFSKDTFSYIHNSLSKEKIFSRNFLIFSAFSLEQKINLISELKEIVSTNYLNTDHIANKNSHTLRAIIDKMDRSTEDNSFESTSITSLLKQSDNIPVQLDYKVNKVDLYIKNPPMHFNEKSLEALIQMDKWIMINDIILDNINSNDPPIAIEYDCADDSFDVIMQYSQREYLSVLFGEILTKYQEYKNSSPYALNGISYMTTSFFEDIIVNGLDTYLNNLERV